MEASQVLILVSILFGLGGLLLGFLLGSSWAMRRQRSEPEQAEVEDGSSIDENVEPAEMDAAAPEAETETAMEEQPTPVEQAGEPNLPVEVSSLPDPVMPAAKPRTIKQQESPSKPKENKQPQKPVSPPSILEQINEIFNEMTADTPLAERGIRLVQDPTLGVTVEVGAECYESIDSVPDEDVRLALKAAVKKWEEG